MPLLFLSFRGWCVNPEVVALTEASLRGLSRPKQEEQVFPFAEFSGGRSKEMRAHLKGIERTHGFGLDLRFRTGRSHLNLAPIAFRVERKQGDVFHRLAFGKTDIEGGRWI